MTGTYRLTTRRALPSKRGERGEYLTEVTYNGKKVDFALSDDLKAIIDEHGLSHIRILANNPNVNQLEFIISGEILK